jgi:uncharacterized protein involved in exopolysaccharide biosynthesis
MDVSDTLGRLAGVADLVDLAGSDEKSVAVEVLRSRSLARQYIQECGIASLLEPDVEEGVAESVVLDRAVRRFDLKVRSVDEDRRTGIITLSIEWFETNYAADWANGLVALLNREMRERAETDARRNLDYLEAALNRTTSIEIRQALYRLMEGELKSAMLAEVREEYALKVIDSAVPPDLKEHVRPIRWLLILGGIVSGFLIGTVLAVFGDLVMELRVRSAK